jgi:hypothetical protein
VAWLLVAIAASIALEWPPPSWSRTICAAVVLAGILVMATVIALIQARAMTALRRQVIANRVATLAIALLATIAVTQ